MLGLAAVLDGHGSSAAAQFAQDHLLRFAREELAAEKDGGSRRALALAVTFQ